MFDDAELDIKKRSKSDKVLENMLDLGYRGFFEENFDLLAAIFSEKGMLKGEHLELAKPDFIMILKDAGVLIIK